MPVTRKQKNKASVSREADSILDLKNMDVLIGYSHFEREGSEFGNSVGRPESPSYDALKDHNSNFYSNPRENVIRESGSNGQISGEASSSYEFSKLSRKMTQWIT